MTNDTTDVKVRDAVEEQPKAEEPTVPEPPAEEPTIPEPTAEEPTVPEPPPEKPTDPEPTAGDDGDRESSPTEETEQPKAAPWTVDLRPYLKKLQTYLEKQGTRDISLSVPLGRRRLLLSPAEQHLILDRCEGSLDGEDTDALMLRAIGLEVRILAALRSLRKIEEDDAEEASASLSADLGEGHHHAHALTIGLRRRREEGRIDESKTLQQRRSHLADTLEEAERRLRILAGEEDDPDTADPEALRASLMAATAHRKPKTKAVAVKPARKSIDRKKWGRVALAVLLVVLVVVLANLWRNRYRELADFSAADFRGVSGIETVVNRSPVLIVVFTDQAWSSMGPAEKRRTVETIGNTIRSAGYKEAQIRTTTSHGIAVWRRKGGVELQK